MSKKRKTRKQKEESAKRHVHEAHIHLESPTYSVANIPVKKTPVASLSQPNSLSQNAYYTILRKDMIAIAAASGIILAFDALLLVLLKSGAVHLNFLGY